jgi:hypothetical protein
MSYVFGFGKGHLPLRAMRLAEDMGAAVTNYTPPGGDKCHWFMTIPGERTTLQLLQHADHVQTALAQWLTSTQQEKGIDTASGVVVDAPVMTCGIHDRALVCPSCRAAAAGRANKGKELTKRAVRQRIKAAKRKRPGARGPRVKEEAAS